MTGEETSSSPIALTAHSMKVLLIDDQRIVGETIRRMLADIPGLE
jgi:PleD family two-component response regulator